MTRSFIICFIVLLAACSGRRGSGGTPANDSIQHWMQTYRRHIERNADSALMAAGKAVLLAQRALPGGLVLFDALYAAGYSAERSGQYAIALDYARQALEYRKGVDDDRLAAAYNLVGQVAFLLERYDLALQYFPEALAIRIEEGDVEGQASSYRNIGAVLRAMRKYEEADDNFMRAVELFMQMKPPDNTKGLADCYNNIGASCAEQGRYAAAFENYRHSERLYEAIGSREVRIPIYNMGLLYVDLDRMELAEEQFRRALVAVQKMPDNSRLLAEAYYSLGDRLRRAWQNDSALVYFNRCVEVAEQSALDAKLSDALLARAEIYAAQRNFRAAVADYDAASHISEMLNRMEQEVVAGATQQYEAYKRWEDDRQQMQRTRLLWYFIVALTLGILLICAVAVILYRNNIQKKRANTVLAQQRDEIEQNRREIESGIQAASRVQKAVLTPDEYVRQILPGCFVYYKPLNAVGGDFYWMTRKGAYIVVAAADCTGHGVSGAVVSMLGISALNKIVGEMETPRSNMILDRLRDDIIKVLNPAGAAAELRNGMDVALAVIDMKQMQIEFSGAKNSLYHVRSGELNVIKADRMSVGVDERQEQPFTTNRIGYRAEDMIYMFSDGYVDQFDATNKHKFGTKQMRELLLSIAGSSPDEQMRVLHDRYSNWRGNTVQTDDILVIGIKL